MNYFEKLLLTHLWSGKLETKITGFDIEGFQKAVEDESKRRLELVESIVYEDEDIISDAEKVKAIKLLFQLEFYDED